MRFCVSLGVTSDSEELPVLLLNHVGLGVLGMLRYIQKHGGAGWTLTEDQTFKKTFWPFKKCHQLLSPFQALTTLIFLWKLSLF